MNIEDIIKKNNSVSTTPVHSKDPIKDLIAKNNVAATYDSFFSPIIHPTGDTGVGESMFDTNIPFSELENLEDIRSQRQPWIAKASAGVTRVGTKALTEIAKMPGVIVGIGAGVVGEIVDSEGNDFIKTAFNNGWVQGLNNLNEDINEELLPVYISKAVREGNLWDNIKDIGFWATEGADGIGYIVSMLAPGAVINRFGAGAKLLNTTTKLARMAGKTDEAANMLTRIGLTPNKADLYASTIANTLFEAGAEAGYAMQDMEDELREELAAGQITQKEFDERMKQVATVGWNIFGANAAILIGPNAAMSKMIWGKPRVATPSSLLKQKGKGVLQPLTDLTRKQKLGDAAKELGWGVLKEGFWEEGMQSTVENYFTENPNSNLWDILGDLPDTYLNTLNTTEGQKAILLGSLFGGTMQSVTGYNNKSNSIKAANKLIDLSNTVLNDIYSVYNEDVYEKTPTGRIKKRNGKPVIDHHQVLKNMKGLGTMDEISQMYDIALEMGQTEVLEKIEDIMITHMVKPFLIDDNVGPDVLRASLEEQLKNVPTKDADFIERVMAKTKVMKQSSNTFNSFKDDLIKFDNENSTESERVNFLNVLYNRYLDTHSNKDYVEKKLDELNKLRETVEKERNIASDLTLAERKKAGKLDARIQNVTEKIKEYEKHLKSIDNSLEDFWDDKKINKEFNKIVNERVSLAKKQQQAEEVDRIYEGINNSKTPEEVDALIPEDPELKKLVRIKANEKKNELKKEKEIRDAEIAAENEKKAQDEAIKKEIELNRVNNNYNEGEEVVLKAGEFAGQVLTVVKKNKNSVTFIVNGNKNKKITLSYETLENNVDRNFSTEGGSTEVSFPLITTEEADNKIGGNNDPKVRTTDANNNYEPLPFVNRNVVDYERNPVDKRGQSVGFEVNRDGNLTKKQKEAVELFDTLFAITDEQIEFLANHLPINVILNDSVKAPLGTRSEKPGNEKYNKIFEQTDYIIRRKIIEQLEETLFEKNAISRITGEIKNQKNGQIQLEEKVLENPLTGLYEFKGNIKNIKSDLLYVVDDYGTLRNTKGDIFPTKRLLAPGEIYLKIHTASGTEFPLKLNVKRITEKQAEALYELYRFRFEDIKAGKNIRIKDIPKEQYNVIITNLANEIAWFNQNKKKTDDITVKDLVDFLIWDGTKSTKSQVRFSNGQLLVGKKKYSSDSFNSSKNEFIKFFTSTARAAGKRHHVKYKRRGDEGPNSPNFENRSYVEYLINNGILNTNAKINQPTFAGDTSIYLSKHIVKLDGELPDSYKTLFDKEQAEKNKKKARPKQQEPIKKESVSQQENDGDLSGIEDLNEGALNVSKLPPIPKQEGAVNVGKVGIEAPEPKSVPSKGYKYLTDKHLIELAQQVQNMDYIISKTIPIGYGSKSYFITNKNFYLINATDNKIEEDIELMGKIIDNLNKFSAIKYDKEHMLSVWKKRMGETNVEKAPIKLPTPPKPITKPTPKPAVKGDPLAESKAEGAIDMSKFPPIPQQAEKTPKENVPAIKESVPKPPVKEKKEILGIDTSNYSDKQIEALRINLGLSYRQYIKQFQVIGKKRLSEKEKLEEIVNYLLDKQVALSEIKTKCGL